VGVPPVERLEDSRQLGVRDTGPPINDSDHQMAAHRSRSDPDRMPLRITCSILEKVRERSLQLGGVELDQRQIAMERHRESVSIPGSIDGRPDQLLDRAPVSSRTRGPRLDAREIEKL